MAASKGNPDYYELLHVSREAPEEIIRASYRTLMQRLRHHPDLGGDATTAAMINEAYSVLTNPERRAAYDLQLAIGDATISPEPRPHPGPSNPDPLFGCWFCRTPHNLGMQVSEDDLCAICFSPLFAVEKQDLDKTGNRAIRRVRKKQPIRFFTHWPQPQGYPGRTEDISLNGMRFTTRYELAVGQVIKITGSSMDAVARVSHCSQKSSGWRRNNVAGVSFLTLRMESPLGGFVSKRV